MLSNRTPMDSQIIPAINNKPLLGTAGFHFPSDVLVGAAVGTTLGVLVPWLHTRADAVLAESSPMHQEGAPARSNRASASSLDWLLLPSLAPGSVGLTVLVR